MASSRINSGSARANQFTPARARQLLNKTSSISAIQVKHKVNRVRDLLP
jgi:hypothetical protein